ncbi:hypothetical protein BDB01DRAFT_808792 [Pilobolus umbonatus]|nr:hypothetical protein BDB01DRAFT_808792 [Pilobolus umbonatus]
MIILRTGQPMVIPTIIPSLLALATAPESIWLSYRDFLFNINNTLTVFDKMVIRHQQEILFKTEVPHSQCPLDSTL